MNRTAKTLAAIAFLALPLGGCVVVPDSPNVEGRPWAQGTPVPLGQPVLVGDVAVTAKRIVEDSRCPINARCVWAGRLIVETRIDGAGWRDTANITLGESYGTHGQVVALVDAGPDKMTSPELQSGQYRFTFADAKDPG
ncbi:hypothetical protein [Qipengyuania zhejiangensis]|uniref:hypothetical protein n=1 Tax=Qipengyuania zhejiangensis TaxID=3077782 RepID=UPI002D78F21A|nr:hypothetical protein [Qipengyuania sp. Z2]